MSFGTNFIKNKVLKVIQKRLIKYMQLDNNYTNINFINIPQRILDCLLLKDN